MLETRPLVVVGLDGLSWKVYNYFIDKENLFLQSILKDSAKYDLKSTIPPTTGVAWTSLFTGVNPGKHGIFGFFKFDLFSHKARLVTSNDIKVERLWEILDKHNIYPQIVINVPISTPFKKFRGIGIPDWLALKPQIFSNGVPSNVRSYVYRNIKDLLRFTGKFWWFNRGNIYDSLNALLNDLRKKISIYSNIIEKYDWSSIIVVISETDWFQHLALTKLFAGDKVVKEKFNALFRIIDDFVKIIYKKYGKEALYFFVSDHGFKVYKRSFYINNIFLYSSLLELKPIIKALYYGRIYSLAKKTFTILKKIARNTNRNLFNTYINYKKSLVFMPEDASALGIRINHIMARKLKLSIPRVRKFIINKLVKLNKKYKVFSLIAERNEIYWGSYKIFAPDIVFLPNFKNHTWIYPSLNDSNLKNEIFSHHDMDGIFALYDGKKEISFKKQVRHLSILDALPIILHSMHIPVPKNLDGKDPKYALQT